jgi:glycosyltransferase involved in cell wall biosynthesis
MISAVVITKNEEKNIVDCLEDLSFATEILVLDDYSQDRTPEVARRMGAKVISRRLNNNFSEQRNYAFSKVTNEWVLFVDADERINAELKEEVLDFIKNPNGYVGAYIKRKDIMWGHLFKFGETGNKKFLRLVKKDFGRWVRPVHEELVIDGRSKIFKNILIHYPHQSVAEFLKEVNHYTDIRARELYDSRVKVKWYSVILYPKLKFLQNYVLKLGFLDGLPGFVLAMIMSFHSFLVRGKLWLLWQKK